MDKLLKDGAKQGSGGSWNVDCKQQEGKQTWEEVLVMDQEDKEIEDYRSTSHL